MIKNITLNGVRGVNASFDLKDTINIFSGKNGSGKSTILQSISDAYRGEKIKVKEGNSVLSNSDSMINRNGNKLFNSPKLDIDLTIPGFLMGKQSVIKGVNQTTEDKRTTISNLLQIDRTKFFLDAGISYDIKGLNAELREMNIKSSTYMDELQELEKQDGTKPEKPKVVKLIPSSEERIEKGNSYELTHLKELATTQKLNIQNVPNEPVKPELVEFIPTKVIVEGNEKEFETLQAQLKNIILKGQNTPSTCSECGQDIKDSEALKIKLRADYIALSEKIRDFDLINTEIIPSNEKDVAKYNLDYSNYLLLKNDRDSIISRNERFKRELDRLQKEITDFVLIEDKVIPAVTGNEEAYNAYLEADKEYSIKLSNIENKESKVSDLKAKIKALNTSAIEDKISKYKETELAFVESVDTKLTVGDMKFVFYKPNISPNAVEPYSATFDILFNGQSYTELSGGEQGMVDVIIATLFIKNNDAIDFILIDNAEISNENIKLLMTEYLTGIQIITTRISTTPLTLTHKI